MKYEEPQPTTRAELEASLASVDTLRICRNLVGFVLHDDDFPWAQQKCLELLRHPNTDVRALAATCLGHLARIHGRIDPKVEHILGKLQSDPDIGGSAEDALSDIEIFVKRKVKDVST